MFKVTAWTKEFYFESPQCCQVVQTKNVHGHGKDQRVSSRAKHLAKYYLGQEYWDPTYMFLIFCFHSYAAERAFKSEMHFLSAAASWSGVMEAFKSEMHFLSAAASWS